MCSRALPTLAIEQIDPFIVKDIQYQAFQDKVKLSIIMSTFIECVSYELQEPHRIIIDPMEEVYCDYQDKVHFEEGPLRSIEFVKTREGSKDLDELYYAFDFLVIELTEATSYDIVKDGSNILLLIGQPQMTAIPGVESLMKEMATDREREFIEELTKTNKENIQELPPVPPKKYKKEKKETTKKTSQTIVQKKLYENRLKKAEEKFKKEAEEIERIIEQEKPVEINLTNELTLKKCTKIALANHLPIKIAKEQVKLARLKVNESFRELFPAASLLWSESHGKINDTLYRGRKYGFEFKQPVFRGGELFFTWQQTKSNLKIAQENYKKEKEELVYETSKAYYDLAKALNNLDVQEELFKNIESNLDLARKEYELGLSTLIEFLNAQSSFDQVYYSIASAKNSVSLKRLKLNKIMNIDISSELKIAYKLELKEFDINIDECVELAMKYRAELKTKALMVKSAELGERIAKSQTLPQIDVVGKYVKSAEAFEPRAFGRNLDNERFLGFTVDIPLGSSTAELSHKRGKLAPTVTTFASNTEYATDMYKLNLLDGLDKYTSMKNAAIAHQQALSDLRDVKQDIHSEVREAFYELKEAEIKLRGSANNLKLYEKELLATNLKKGLNEATVSEVMDAKIKLSGEQSTYINAIGDIYLAIAGLNKAIGMGGYFK